MDDSEHLCPLCCEELDLSDREFYPCKCGYQVCMWCWHRIRETESGLCPACRTPYGEDPHQFSAVDVEEVLKANKEKEAAAKRDRQQRQHNHHHHHISQTGSTADGSSATTSSDDPNNDSPMDIPKDRTQLANMRVIRRNLVYAVGLPPGAASEDTLRKPEYFGQYGKIAKIVLNRSQITAAGDPRRASASAYVTFVHKEDTLSCILALDGFHIDGRNIRASYGTSKYCSAFIKNVRCNNPDCTYLHEMGAAEDTFTKQEIQAGYVTSGRDVLARQQQIVAEQLRQAGSGSSAPRKRVGAGGPSGTGKASAHPVFPPPEYDEPAKANPTLVPPPVGVTRASTIGGASGAAVPIPSARVSTRTASVGSKSPVSSVAGAAPPAHTAAAVASANLPPQRKPVSAASVVAGMHSVSSRPEPPAAEPHTTLTPLTPLKRSSKTTATRTVSVGDTQEKISPRTAAAVSKKKNGFTASASATQQRPEQQQQQQPNCIPNNQQSSSATATAPPDLNGARSGPSLSSSSSSSIGGDPIGPPSLASSSSVLGAVPEPSANLGSGPSSLLGGDVFTGQLPSNSRSAIGSGKDKWNSGSSSFSNGDAIEGNAIESSPVGVGGSNTSTTLWGGIGGHPTSQGLAPGLVGSRAPGPPGTIGNGCNSSSALASLLGISLPTGSGSLQETTNTWSVAPGPTPVTPSPLASLNSGSVPMHGNVIGGQPVGLGGGNSLIGGVPIGGGSLGGGGGSSYDHHNPSGGGGGGGFMGGGGGNANTKSDIALLQSLLPGVHITSGSDTGGFGTIGSWNHGTTTARSGPSSLNGDAIVHHNHPHHHHHHHNNMSNNVNHNNNNNSSGWGNGQGSTAVGTIGGRAIPQPNHRDKGIW